MASNRKTSKKAAAKKTPAKKTAAKKSAKPAARGQAAPKGLSLTAVSPSLTVDDVAKSLAWYRDVLGFSVGQRWEEKGKLMGIELKAGASTFMIGQDDWAKGRHRIKGAGFRLYCETDQDIDRMADGIKARGGSLLEGPSDEPEWNSRYITLQDPDGFKITISSRS